MRRDKWGCLFNLLVRKQGELEGKRRFRELWKQAGEQRIEEYEREEEFRMEVLFILDGRR